MQEVQDGIDAWKATYSTAWEYMLAQQLMVQAPGYVTGCWGRRRYFHKVDDEYQMLKYEREAQNFAIQNTVADTMRIALAAVRAARDAGNYKFRICNQIHDALLLEVPEAEIQVAAGILRTCMGQIPIPMPDGSYLTLGVDLSAYSRWGVAIKDIRI